MAAPLGPLRFEPFLRPMVWGGRALEARLGKSLPTSEPYGESWEISDHALHRSVVAEGPRAGTTLRQLMEQERDALLGPAANRFDTFPWLIKFLDCCDWLSVQVHPDAEAVKTLWPGEGSKTEAWYVIDAQPKSRIYAGLQPGVGPAELRDALARGTVEECLYSFIPQPGDCVFLPAGTVHAVGGGVLMAEIQETSDATFRLFDWNRVDAQGKSRKLHIEEAFAALHWEYGPVQPRRVPTPVRPGFYSLVKSASFELDYVFATDDFGTGDFGQLKAIIVLEGDGRWRSGERIAPGQVWVLPTSSMKNHIDLARPLRALLATLP
jgi:mannose-6-phosphate isomerase